jgi:hypothetical protein
MLAKYIPANEVSFFLGRGKKISVEKNHDITRFCVDLVNTMQEEELTFIKSKKSTFFSCQYDVYIGFERDGEFYEDTPKSLWSILSEFFWGEPQKRITIKNKKKHQTIIFNRYGDVLSPLPIGEGDDPYNYPLGYICQGRLDLLYKEE